MKRFLHSRKRKITTLIVAAIILLPNVSFAFPGALDIGLAIFSFFAELAGLAGVVLNLAVTHLVIQFGQKMQMGFGASVENAWTIIRDVVNICFIFGLVYIGFKVILDNASQARKMLPPLIIAALLINFSLFFTKIIIDITNVAAVEIYQSALQQDATGAPAGVSRSQAELDENAKNVGISGAYMQIMGLKALISPDRNQEADEENFLKMLGNACTGKTSFSEGDLEGKCTNTIFLYFMVGSIFMLVAIYAFLAGAFLLVVRFISLIVLMILSPLMFLTMALPLPGTSGISKKWWNAFLSAAFMAPAYFLFLYIGLAVGSRTQIGDINMFRAASGDYTALEGILNLIIVAAFMLFAITTARSMAKAGSSTTLSIADNVRRRGQRLMMAGAAGGAAYAGRQTLGKGAQNMSENKRRIELSQGKGLRAWYNRQLLSGAKNVSGKSFDLRNSSVAAAGVGALGGDMKKEFGEGKKGGYAQKLKDVKKKEEQNAELFGANDKAVYRDYGAEDTLKAYEGYQKAKSEAEKELASLPIPKKGESDKHEMRRTQLLSEINTNSTYIKTIESDKASTFNKARAAEKGYGARRYAANRETAWTEGPVRKGIGWIFTDAKARKAGANAVKKKHAQKGTDQKLKDVIKELEGSDGSTPPAPTPPAGGSSTT